MIALMYRAIFLFLLPTFFIECSFGNDHELNIKELPFGERFPESYSLLMLDASLIPSESEEKERWQTNIKASDDLKDRISSYLRPQLIKEENLTFDPSEKDRENKSQYIIQKRKRRRVSINKKSQISPSYYIIQLFKKKELSKAENLLGSLSEQKQEFTFQSALLIFFCRQDETLSMAYGFGHWNSLLNPACIRPQWGVRLLASEDLCDPTKIKSVNANHYRSSTPHSKKETACNVRHIKNFDLEVGSEEIKSLSLMPNTNNMISSHVLEGADHLHFTINPSEEYGDEVTLHSLYQIASYFFDMTTKEDFAIHPDMEAFIDNEVNKKELIKNLNENVQNILIKNKGKNLLFIHDKLWGEMGSKKLCFGDNRKISIFDALKAPFPSSKAPFPSSIKVYKSQSDYYKEFPTLTLFYSLPLKHRNGHFYRMNRGHWYEVAPSRFDSIKKVFNTCYKESRELHLPSYNEKKESDYNSKVIPFINQKENSELTAICLDCINVYLGGNEHKFEFADLLISDNQDIYIVHVKRARVKQLSHHREQVERCADFLKTELTKDNAHDILLKGIIKDLYRRKNLKNKNFEEKIKTIAKEEKKGYQQSNALNFYEELSRKSLNPPGLLISDILSSLKPVKQSMELKQILFPQGSLMPETLKKIKIVLAIINDNDKEWSLEEDEKYPFKNQDLWGLDRTRAVVEKAGVTFIWTIINKQNNVRRRRGSV